jgi:hypothetical protein
MNYELTPAAYLWDNGQIKLWLDGPKLPMGVKSIITPRPVYFGSPLIEAAPDLMEALEWIAARYDSHKSTHECATDAYEMACKARAAIAKYEEGL